MFLQEDEKYLLDCRQNKPTKLTQYSIDLNSRQRIGSLLLLLRDHKKSFDVNPYLIS